jgi:nucleoside-diphosphate-sugar epimerase
MIGPGSSILVPGGAGYIGSVLTAQLLARGYRITVLDCLLFGRQALAEVERDPLLTIVEGDIRDPALVGRVLAAGFDAVIHLAAISNDPSSELDPNLTRAVNLDALRHLMAASKAAGVGRFLYASSASVYGVKEELEVTEELALEPITLYARYKAEGEAILASLSDETFCGVAVRSATVCGYSPRLRLDLTINLLTDHALNRGRIRVFGGAQMRPNIHIRDLADFYLRLLTAPRERIQGEAFNVCASNASVRELAELVRTQVDSRLPIDVVPTDDERSYRLSTGKVERTLGFVAATPLAVAVRELVDAHREGRVSDWGSPQFHNVQWLKQRPEFWSPAFASSTA